MFVINEPEIGAHAKKIVRKVWGTEFWIINNDRYCMKVLKINPGFQCSIHRHEQKDETFIGLQGTLRLDIHDEKGKIAQTHGIDSGKRVRIRPGVYHSFQATNLTWVMEVSTPHSDEDVTRIQESRKINGEGNEGN